MWWGCVPPLPPTCHHPTDCLFVPFTETEEKVKLCHFAARRLYTWCWLPLALENTDTLRTRANKHSGVKEKKKTKKTHPASLLVLKILWLLYFLSYFIYLFFVLFCVKMFLF